MTTALTSSLIETVQSECGTLCESMDYAFEELTLTVSRLELLTVLQRLRDVCGFEQLIDLLAVDYAAYGQDEWKTNEATSTGFSRAVEPLATHAMDLSGERRFAVVYHLLSLQHNARVRVKVFLPGDRPMVSTATALWPCADWHEREAFDMMGIVFEGHPDLRRILTDYGFVGHPFRKDFPLSGSVEMRYDAATQRVIYGPVEIEPRVLVPRVIRNPA
jgi:NADH-quinone oxidoreductase subunit C